MSRHHPDPKTCAHQIDAVTKEWQDRQAKKKEAEQQGKKADADSATDKETLKSSTAPSASTSPSPPPPPQQTLEKFALHKDIFRMRIDKWNRKRATNRAAQIPGAPRSSFR